jgi:transcriptional regulator with XRE-family HTH domain
MSIRQVIGARVRQLRGFVGLTQDQLTDAARERGFSWGRTTISEIESGKRGLSVAELLAVPAIFNDAAAAATPSLDVTLGLLDILGPGPNGKVALSPALVVDQAGMRALLGLEEQ